MSCLGCAAEVFMGSEIRQNLLLQLTNVLRSMDNERTCNKWTMFAHWMNNFAASERTSLNRSTAFTINEWTLNIQRTLHNESRMCTINERIIYNQWTTCKQRRILDYNNYGLISVIQFIQCANIVHYSKFVHWLC